MANEEFMTEKDWDAVSAYLDVEINNVFSNPMFEKCYFCSFFAQIYDIQDKGYCNKHNAAVDCVRDDCRDYQRNDEAISDWIINACNLNDGWRI